jgi:ADP-ribose pyrophosphatase YjhB (NUDIX family)
MCAQRLASFGVLLYRQHGPSYQYLLGKIPQGNFWTCFKGMPQSNETPEATALREFAEGTGSTNSLVTIDAIAALTGKARKKDLSIFLQDGSKISESIFDIDRVVKFDSGFMEGHPKIIAIRW